MEYVTKLIQYQVKRKSTVKKLIVKEGLEPGTFSTTQAQKQHTYQLSHGLLLHLPTPVWKRSKQSLLFTIKGYTTNRSSKVEP